jgi:hypothetical protein
MADKKDNTKIVIQLVGFHTNSVFAIEKEKWEEYGKFLEDHKYEAEQDLDYPCGICHGVLDLYQIYKDSKILADKPSKELLEFVEKMQESSTTQLFEKENLSYIQQLDQFMLDAKGEE